MANLDRSKKLLVRVALVSGSTVATLVGAQTVATIDQNALSNSSVPAALPAETLPPLTATPVPTVEIAHQAPSIVILRQPSALTNVQPVNSAPPNPPSNNPVILPPNPQEISAPAPVIVQQQAPAVSRSSRG